jgi:two-component system response regulator DegU
MTITALLIDDNQLFREGVAEFIRIAPDIHIVGQAANGLDGFVLAEETRPDVVIMDWIMPGMGGLDATRLIKQRLPEIQVIVLTMHADEFHVKNALRGGARGYLLKEDTVEHLVQAIRTVAGGDRYFSPRLLPIVQNAKDL